MKGIRLIGVGVILFGVFQLLADVYGIGICHRWWTDIGPLIPQMLDERGWCLVLSRLYINAALAIPTIILGIIIIVITTRGLAEEAARNRRL